MPKLITVYWRDIPAQVIAKQGRVNTKKLLPPRFARAIDRAAMRAGRGSSDLYLSDWRRDIRMCEGDPERLVHDEAARLESRFSPQVLNALVQAGGILRREEAEPRASVETGPNESPRTDS